MARTLGLVLVFVLVAAAAICAGLAAAETIDLASVLPKIEAIHEDAKSLLIKNVELKNKILAGFQAQNEAKIQNVMEGKPMAAGPADKAAPAEQQQGLTAEQAAAAAKQQKMANFQASTAANGGAAPIDYGELEEFNKWVEVNLEYAVKNTQATAEALKDEAQTNNGNVEYTEQAVKDGIEGVKYWQAAVIFQDKTLKNEQFEPQLD